MSHKPSALGHAAGDGSGVVSSNWGALLAVLHVFMTVAFTMDGENRLSEYGTDFSVMCY